MATTYVEHIEQEYTIDQTTGKWSGTRHFTSPVADLATNLATLQALSWTVNSIALTPAAVRVLPDDPECPKTARISIRWEFPQDPHRFVVGRGYLSASVSTSQARAKVDYTGTWDNSHIIEGATAADKDAGIAWKVVSGSNIVPVRRVIVRIATAYARTAFNWSTYVASYYSTNGRPKKNNDACANIFDAQAGELLMLGIEIPQAFVLSPSNDRIPVVYTMLHQKGGVEKDPTGATLTVRRFQKSLANRYVLHETDTPANRLWLAKNGDPLAGSDSGPTLPPASDPRTRIGTIDKPVDAAATSRTLYESTSYSDLNGMIYWGA